MSSRSCPMVYHDNLTDHWDWPEGHFGYGVNMQTMYLRLPANSCVSMCIIPIRLNHGDGERAWNWDGNIEKPTLSPSIHHNANEAESADYWHGFVTAGEMKGV